MSKERDQNFIERERIQANICQRRKDIQDNNDDARKEDLKADIFILIKRKKEVSETLHLN